MHSEYAALMSLALDGEATPDEVALLQRHLAFCVSCSAMWMQWQALDAHLKTAPVASPARSLARPVVTRLEQRRRWRSWGGWMGLGLAGIWLSAAAALCMIVAATAMWAASHPLHASVILSAGACLFSNLLWPVRSMAEMLHAAGLSLWTGIGGLVAGTGCLLGFWLWLLAKRGVLGRPRFITALH